MNIKSFFLIPAILSIALPALANYSYDSQDHITVTSRHLPKCHICNDDCNVESLFFTPDGRKIVAFCNAGTFSEEKSHIRLLDAKSGKLLASVTDNFMAVDLSQDGKTIAATVKWRDVRLFNAETLEPIGKTINHPNRVDKITLSNTDNKLAITRDAIEHNELFIWNIKSQKYIGTPLRYTGVTMNLAFSPDGGKIAVVYARTNNSQYLCVKDIFTSRKNIIQCYTPDISFSPDSKKIVVNNSDKALVLDTTTGKTERTLYPDSGEYISSIKFAPDGATVFGCGGNKIYAWNILSNDKYVKIVKNKVFSDIEFNPKGGNIILGESCTSPLEMVLWNVKENVVKKIAIPKDTQIDSERFSPDGKQIIIGGEKGKIYRWDIN